MKISSKYLLALLFAASYCPAQTGSLPLAKGGCQLYKHNLYCFGFLQREARPVFCVYKLNPQLKVLDSILFPLQGASSETYLLAGADTLHDYLNIYIQQKEKNSASVLRFNQKFEQVAFLRNIEVARLNNQDMLGPGPFYFKNSVYSVITRSDTSGRQFFLNKYELKSETDNFDYEMKWQFAFERKFIHHVYLFYADIHYLLAFVTVNGGVKKGQWLLKINTLTGKLIKGVKLNDKTESAHYVYGTCYMDKGDRSLRLVGQKLNEAHLNYGGNKLGIANAPQTSIYALQIDSLGEILSRQEFKIPVVEIKSGVKKINPGYLLRLTGLRRLPEGGFAFEADTYRNLNDALDFFYVNTTVFRLLPQDEKLVMEKNSVNSNADIESFYSSNDKLDLNGRLHIDSLAQLERLFYNEPPLPVKRFFKTDELNNPHWLLAKWDIKKTNICYALLLPVKKNYELKKIKELARSSHSGAIRLSGKDLLLVYESEDGTMRLEMFNW